MGNSLWGPKHVRLGRYAHAAIDITREKPERKYGGGYSQGWTVSYTPYDDDSSCSTLVYLEKVVDRRDCVSEVFLELQDDSGMRMPMRITRAQTDFLSINYEWDKSFEDMMMSFKKKQTSNNPPGGGVTLTHAFCYATGSKMDLVVVEGQKKSINDMNLCTATVAHYYAIWGGPNKIDLGLSVMINIWGSYNNLDFAVQGPDRHPPSALLYMYELISRSEGCKPAAFPYYAQTQRQFIGFSGQYEFEPDSDQDYSEEDGETENDEDCENENDEDCETESEYRRIHNNKNITGDGNGNVIKGNQKLKKSLNFIYNRHKHKHA